MIFQPRFESRLAGSTAIGRGRMVSFTDSSLSFAYRHHMPAPRERVSPSLGLTCSRAYNVRRE